MNENMLFPGGLVWDFCRESEISIQQLVLMFWGYISVVDDTIFDTLPHQVVICCKEQIRCCLTEVHSKTLFFPPPEHPHSWHGRHVPDSVAADLRPSSAWGCLDPAGVREQRGDKHSRCCCQKTCCKAAQPRTAETINSSASVLLTGTTHHITHVAEQQQQSKTRLHTVPERADQR